MSNQETGNKLFEKLQQWGVPAVVAAALVAAGYAVLVSLGVLTLDGCTAIYKKLPDASQYFEGSVALPPTPATVTK